MQDGLRFDLHPQHRVLEGLVPGVVHFGSKENELVQVLRGLHLPAQTLLQDITHELEISCLDVQDLVENEVKRKGQIQSEGELKDNNSKKSRLSEPDYDDDPKLPGNSGITHAISVRLWSESRGMKADDAQARRITVNKHTAIQEGKHSENYAKRARGASSERASKALRGNAGRIHTNDLQAINRIVKQVTAKASS